MEQISDSIELTGFKARISTFVRKYSFAKCFEQMSHRRVRYFWLFLIQLATTYTDHFLLVISNIGIKSTYFLYFTKN